MKTILLILIIAIFGSCSTAYKSGQTPDDVYYAKPRIEAERETKVERSVSRYEDSYEDTQIRMAIRNQRWRSFDYNNDYDWNYNPYRYGFNYGYYYNPFYYPYPVFNTGVSFVNPKNTAIRTTNLRSYNNTVSTYTPTKSGITNITNTNRRYYNSINPTRRNIDTRTYNDTRSYSPSNSGGGGGGGSRPSGNTVTRPSR